MNIQPLATEGIDTATFLVIVSAMATALAGLAGLFYKRLLSENAELRQRLAGYEQTAPQLITQIQELMIAYDRLSSGSTPPGSSSPPARSRKRSPAP